MNWSKSASMSLSEYVAFVNSFLIEQFFMVPERHSAIPPCLEGLVESLFLVETIDRSQACFVGDGVISIASPLAR